MPEPRCKNVGRDKVRCEICGFCNRCRIHQSGLMKCPVCQPDFVTRRNKKPAYRRSHA
jgi:hypothetical protein